MGDFAVLLPLLVSLFTRERIEIPSHIMRDEVGYVSLFTRERIEIFGISCTFLCRIKVSLFTRERIEI